MQTFETFAAAVRAHRPRLAVVLGSGFGMVPHQFAELASVSFADVPDLATPSVHGHSGTIHLGRCAGRPLLVFRGRLHYYEGHSWDRVAGPVRTAAELGAKNLLLTNAAGGIHDALGPGDLMVLRGHIFLQQPIPVTQVADLCASLAGLKSRPTLPPYSEQLVGLLQQIERERNRELKGGVYAAVTGPCYETPAEIRALRSVGADVVGMSTAFEAETAAELGMDVAAISCVTNKAAGLTTGILDHREVLANAAQSAGRISEILEDFAALMYSSRSA